MRRFEHGGDIYSHEHIIDFSANLNPLGMPQAVREALRENIDAFEAYPDTQSRELTKAIARAEGLRAAHIICTAGASDLFERIAQLACAKKALVASPCYSGYEQALDKTATQLVRHPLDDEHDYALTSAFLQQMTEGVSLVFIANPNNPTGLTVDCELIKEVLERARCIGARVVLDESFIDFTDAESFVSQLERYPQLIIAKSYTKIFAIAGLRLGFGACSDEAFMRALREAGQPWAVSTPAQLAGIAALGEAGFVEASREYVSTARAELKEELGTIGLRVIDGQANYLMFQHDGELYAPLLKRGILIRSCANYDGLVGTWYRVAVRAPQDNARLIAALKEECS